MLPDKIALKVPEAVAQHKIKNQIEKGNAILELVIETEAHYNIAKASNNNWMKNTKCLLLELSVAEGFPIFLWSKGYNSEDFYEASNDFKEAVNRAVQYLKTVLSRVAG